MQISIIRSTSLGINPDFYKIEIEIKTDVAGTQFLGYQVKCKNDSWKIYDITGALYSEMEFETVFKALDYIKSKLK